MSSKLPLLDGDFDPSQLMDAVARKRMQQAQLLGHSVTGNPRDYLEPSAAKRVLSEIYGTTDASDPYARGSSELAGRRQDLAKEAKDRIFGDTPEWRTFDELPIAMMQTPATVLSYSCICHPQHLFFGEVSFKDENLDLMIENFLHEFAHNWLYLLQEISAFSADRHHLTYVLPSGTPNRPVTAVIDAAYVAAVLRYYYAKIKHSDREAELAAYLGGCLVQIRNDPDLTRVGLSVCRRLSEEVARLS